MPTVTCRWCWRALVSSGTCFLPTCLARCYIAAYGRHPARIPPAHSGSGLRFSLMVDKQVDRSTTMSTFNWIWMMSVLQLVLHACDLRTAKCILLASKLRQHRKKTPNQNFHGGGGGLCSSEICARCVSSCAFSTLRLQSPSSTQAMC